MNIKSTLSKVKDRAEIMIDCPELYNDTKVKYEDIFTGNFQRQFRAAKLFDGVIQTKDKLQDIAQ